MGRSTSQGNTSPGNNRQRPAMGAHAMAYSRKGWAIVPLWWVVRYQTAEQAGACACGKGADCTSPGKHPHTQHGTKEPLKTPLEVELYWSRHPYCNIGIATGAISGFVVLDIDPGKGGADSMRALWQRYGQPTETPVSVTGGGGRHVLFAHPGSKVKNAIGYKPGIDVRGDGGLIVAPPSIHVTGRRYHWHELGHPRDHDPAAMPTWMMVFCEASEAARRKRNRRYNGSGVAGRSKYGRALDPDRIPGIAEGERNNTLCSIAGRLIWENRTEEEVLDLVQRINDNRCAPPLPDKEVSNLVRHAYRRWATKP